MLMRLFKKENNIYTSKMQIKVEALILKYMQ